MTDVELWSITASPVTMWHWHVPDVRDKAQQILYTTIIFRIIDGEKGARKRSHRELSKGTPDKQHSQTGS